MGAALKLSRLFVLAAAGLALAGPAIAGGPRLVADEMPVAASPAALQDWQGFHFGIAAALPMGDSAWDTATYEGGGASVSADWKNARPTLSFGYSLQNGAMVYGVELTYTPGTIQSDIRGDNLYFGCSGSACSTEVTNLIELRGRVGHSIGRSLVYVAGGPATAKATALFGPTPGVLGQDRLNGYSVGLGLEYALGARTTLRVEYTHVDLGTLDIPISCETCSVDPVFGALRMGVSLRW